MSTPRKDYISDNLVDIRDRVKQNYAAVTAAKSVGEAGNSPSIPAAAAEPVHPMIHAESVSREDSTAERQRRELRLKVCRDLAAAAAELELLELRRSELRRFHTELKSIESEISNGSCGVDIETLRRRYSEAIGRGSVFVGNERRSGGAGEISGSRWLDALPLISGMFLASVLIVLALIFIFL